MSPFSIELPEHFPRCKPTAMPIKRQFVSRVCTTTLRARAEGIAASQVIAALGAHQVVHFFHLCPHSLAVCNEHQPHDHGGYPANRDQIQRIHDREFHQARHAECNADTDEKQPRPDACEHQQPEGENDAPGKHVVVRQRVFDSAANTHFRPELIRTTFDRVQEPVGSDEFTNPPV